MIEKRFCLTCSRPMRSVRNPKYADILMICSNLGCGRVLETITETKIVATSPLKEFDPGWVKIVTAGREIPAQKEINVRNMKYLKPSEARQKYGIDFDKP